MPRIGAYLKVNSQLANLQMGLGRMPGGVKLFL
uniref:Uncharacterized protein n=1 Tax=Rhizophora mucronata TaxID=61149 RepID=A0A2P2N4B1_RHIMU